MSAGLSFVVLGSGTPLPDPDRGSAGFAVGVDGRWWLVDGGSGTIQRLERAGIPAISLQGGVYSHHHPDHCADLVPLLFAHRVLGRAVDYPIWAGVGFRAFFDALQGVWGKWIALKHAGVPIHELPLDADATIDLGGLTLRTAPAVHSASALHLRFEAHGRAVVFSGDTGPGAALARLAAGADLLVCECGAAAPSDSHLAPDDVVAVAAAARPRAVWVTHVHPGVGVPDLLARLRTLGVAADRPEDGARASWPSAP